MQCMSTPRPTAARAAASVRCAGTAAALSGPIGPIRPEIFDKGEDCCRMYAAARACGVAASGASSTVCRWVRLFNRSSPASLGLRSGDLTASRAIQHARRRPTTVAAAPAAAASEPAMAPTERPYGEWESPITSDLITSAVSKLDQQAFALAARCLKHNAMAACVGH